MFATPRQRASRFLNHFAAQIALLSALAVSACVTMPEPEGPPRKELVYAVTDAAELIHFNAGQPQRILSRKPVLGLPSGDKLVGIDYRISRGVLYTLSTNGRLYTLNTASGQLSAVGSGAPVALSGQRFGFDFNPAADRIRVVSDTGQNVRLHPDTGAVAAIDAPLRMAPGDAGGSRTPRIGGAAYTYNKQDDKLTTNYAIDLDAGALLMQGSKEGVGPAVSPNTGLLTTVGALGTGPIDDASFDIADIGNTALAALKRGGRTRLHLVDLATGRATLLGTVGDGRALWGMAIEP